MLLATIVLLTLGILIYLFDRRGAWLAKEQEKRFYLINEGYRKEDGKNPITWRGSLEAYNQDCQEVDEKVTSKG